MKNWKELLLIPALLAAALSAQNAAAQSPPQQSSSAQNSQSSATPVQSNGFSRDKAVTPKGVTLNPISACAAAVNDLKASRALIDALESENRALNERLEIEKQTTAILKELSDTRKSETNALRDALAAKNETIAAKDKVIDAQDKSLASLKNTKRSPLGRIGDILIGAAITAVLR